MARDPAPFLGSPRPVDLVARLEAMRVDGSGVVLECSTDRYEPELQDYYGTVCETVLSQPGVGRPATIRADFWSPSVIRFRYAPSGMPPEDALPPLPSAPDAVSPMLVGHPEDVPGLDVEELEDRVRVNAGNVRLTVIRFPFRLEIHDRDGRLLWATRPVDIDGLRLARNQWNPPEQRWLFLHRYAYPLGSTVQTDARTAFASFDLGSTERIVGFGESFGRLDKVGSTQDLWLQEAFGNASPAAYKQVPFYLSSRGHGVFLHTANAARVHVGSREHTAVSLVVDDAGALDWFVLAGTPAEVLHRYTALTGRPSVPPLWSFGFWLGRITYRSQEEVETVAQELRRRRIPTDVLHIDTGWFEQEYTCDLEFSRSRFPEPAAMLDRLRDQGFRVCLWQWPNYNVGSPLFDEGLKAGHLAGRPSGHTFTFPGGYGQDAGLVDFSVPEAVAWYQDKLRALFDLGVAVIKVDYGEGAPPTATYGGAPASAMHNLYPLLYQDAVWEASRRARGDDTVIWARAGWAGSQRYPVHWSGDGVARFEDLACVLRGMLSLGLSGFCFSSHDVGGFSGNPSPELYVRWLQLGVFSSHVRAHGSPPREPWEYGPEVERLSRRFLELRYRLLPYLYTAAVDGVATSTPVVRPLLLHHPDDRASWDVDDQYYFGPDLLVAPVLEEGGTGRRVYLPPGGWHELATGRQFVGGRHVEVAAPLDEVPLFARDGAMIPLGPTRQFVEERGCDPLELHVWGRPRPGRRTVHLDQFLTAQVDVSWGAHGFTVSTEGAPGNVRLIAHPAPTDTHPWA